MAERNAPAAEPEDDDRLLAAMIAETEDEIFSEATGKDQDENDGNTDLEEMTDDIADGDADEPEAEEPEGETEDDEVAEAAPQRDERNERFVPSGRLREEADARRAAEAREAELRSRLDVLTGQVQALSSQPRQEPQAPPAEPDMFVDPDGWKQRQRDDILSQVRREMSDQRVNMSMDAAKENYGAEFQHVYDHVRANANDPIVRQRMQRVLSSYDPGEAMMKAFEPELASYREQRTEEARSLLSQMYGVEPDVLDRAMAIATKATGRSDNYPQRPRQSLPSLNSASGGGRRPAGDAGGGSSEGDIFASAFSDRR